MYNKNTTYRPRGYSSVGRALEWHSRGQGFNSPYLHHALTSHKARFFMRGGDKGGQEPCCALRERLMLVVLYRLCRQAPRYSVKTLRVFPYGEAVPILPVAITPDAAVFAARRGSSCLHLSHIIKRRHDCKYQQLTFFAG